MTQETLRGAVLLEVKAMIEGARNRSHGDPEPQFDLAGTIKDFMRACAVMPLEPAEWECIDMIVTKLSRTVMGKERNLDNPKDIIGYAAILYEVMTAVIDRSVKSDPTQEEANERT